MRLSAQVRLLPLALLLAAQARAGAVATGSAPAGGGARPLSWTASRGSLQPGVEPGSFLLSTDAAPSRFSDGEAVGSEPLRLPFRLEVRWRRLGPEAGRSLHVAVVGGVVLIKSGAVGFYAFDDALFHASGWFPVPGLRTQDEHLVSVEQGAREVVLAIDGREVKRFAFAPGRDHGAAGVGFKGASGFRSRLLVRSLTVSELGRGVAASR